MGKSQGLVDGDMSAITNATTKIPGRTTSDIDRIVTELCLICPQLDCIDIICEGSGEQIDRQLITKNLVIELDKNYFKMWFPNDDNDKVSTIGPHFIMGKRKRQKMLEEYNKTPDEEKSIKYNYDLYEKVKSLAKNSERYTFHNRNYLKKKKQSVAEAGSPKIHTELFRIKIICDAAALARLATPKPADIFEQLIVLQELQQSLYKSSVDYVKRIAASYFKRCHKHVVSNINSTAFNGGYDAIRIVIRQKYFLLKLLKKCTELVKNFVKLNDVFGHLFDQAMKWRLLKIEGNDAVLTESRTQKNNFYADILRDATDNVYGTTKNAVTSYEKRLKKKNACDAIISGVPCHDQRSATIVTTPSSHTQHSGETLGSANVSAATATISEGRKEDNEGPPAMKSTTSVTNDDGYNNAMKSTTSMKASADEWSNTETLSKRMLNSYEKQKPCFTEGNTKLPATATTVAPTENNGMKGGKEDAVFEGRKGKDDGPPALKSTTSSSTPVTKDELIIISR